MTSISRAAFVALAASLSFASVGAAQAREHGVRPAVHHAEDFYAYSASDVASPAPAVESRGCFTTNSPMEAAKGIRHWSGRC